MKNTILTFTLLATFSVLSASGQALKVPIMEFGTDIEDRKLIGESTYFDNTVGKVYCFTRIVGARDSTKIRHVWYYEDNQKERIELEVRSADWRTWSYKTIPSIWTGDWRVEVWDENGNILARKTFTIRDNRHDD